jgi:hypothetical protein
MAPGGWSVFGPESFQGYRKANGLPERQTAPLISVDFLGGASPW